MVDTTSNRKKVVFFSNHLRGPKGSAGARSWHQANALAKDYDLTVLIPRIDPVSATEVSEHTYSGLHEKVKVIRVSSSKNNRVSKISRLFYYLTTMCSQAFVTIFKLEKPDLVFSMTLPVTQLALALIVAKVHGVPFVVDLRDLPYDLALEMGYLKNKPFANFLKSLEGFCLRRANKVLTNSPRYVSHIVKKGVSPEDISVAPIGYDDFDEPDKSKIVEWRAKIEAGFPYNPKYIGMYAGTLGFAFPVEQILQSARNLDGRKDIGLAFFGDGQQLEFYKQFASDNGINAFFGGRVEKHDIHAICRAVDFCMYPALDGEFSSAILGNKIFDYLGAKKPILYIGPDSAVSDVIVELDAGVICDSLNFDAYSSAIMEYADNNELLARHANGASKFREKNYTAVASANILKEIVDFEIGPD